MPRFMITLLSCALLALITAASAWLAWPTGRAFSFLNDARPVFRIEARENFMNLQPGQRPKAAKYDLAGTLSALQAGLGERAWVYAVANQSMQDRLRAGSRLVTSLETIDTLGPYQEARGLTLIAGHDPGLNAPEIVLSESVARRLADDPLTLLGQQVIRNEHVVPEPLTVTGIVRPSPWRGPEDPDAGGYRRVDPAAPGADQFLSDFATPAVTVVFRQGPSPADVQFLQTYTRTRLRGLQLTDLRALRDTPEATAVRNRVIQRSRSLPLLAGLLVGSGLLSLGALTLSGLLRRRVLLGTDLALGGRRGRLLGAELGRSVAPALLGAALGTPVVYLLPAALPGVVVGTPPTAVLLLAGLLPPLALGALTLTLCAGVLRESVAGLLRGARPGQVAVPLLVGLLLAFGLALGGVLSALGVGEGLDAQARRVTQDFGRVLELATSGSSDTRRGASGAFTSRALTAADVRWLADQPGVASVAIGERINGFLDVRGRRVYVNRLVTGDPGLLDVLGITVRQGRPGGCLLNADLARTYGVGVGDTVSVPGREGTRPCPVSGLYDPPDALTRFVMVDFPEVIVPPEVGLPGQQDSLPGMKGAQPTDGVLRTTTLLLRLDADATPARVMRLRDAIGAHRPGLAFALTPAAPSIDALLERLAQQGRLFLGLALAAGALSSFGLLGGFLAYLDATRYRTALDRSQGLSRQQLRRRWALGGLALGLLGSALALGMATMLTPALANAFSLDAPLGLAGDLLPEAHPALPGPLTLGAAALVTGTLTLLLTRLGERWLAGQRLGALLSAGS
ncbi:ABC transporter permease [Deinococcus sp. Arct2-2]|uniref:ABC transporter permease n=1 Tax=Deinococcus sp. Arct2-2 TaxID=2568653 RepID=UPI0010A34C4B|nr:ABC transporter permease [Deinococcus sp. Arct2-2]THF68017.1 ABC transporter permease [Deinococcus sp. Arct2-2]